MITKEEAEKLYADLIQLRRSEVLIKSKDNKGQIEIHHILPRSCGGTDDESNKIALYAKEHFMTHVYLWCIYRNTKFHNQVVCALNNMIKGTLDGFRQELRNFILASEEYQKAKEDFAILLSKKSSEINKGENNPMYGKHWYKDPNSNQCGIFYTNEQPDGWIIGRYQKANTLISIKLSGTKWITNIKTNKSQQVQPDIARQLVESGEYRYGHIQKPMSEQGKLNIKKAFATREYKYVQPANKGKLKFKHKDTGIIKYFLHDEVIPNGFVKTHRKNSEKQLLLQEQHKQRKLEKHQAWLKETQEMADYYVQYGYEATCKKFNVHMSVESMIMRFIRARNKYGIKFESIKTGRKRIFPGLENLK